MCAFPCVRVRVRVRVCVQALLRKEIAELRRRHEEEVAGLRAQHTEVLRNANDRIDELSDEVSAEQSLLVQYQRDVSSLKRELAETGAGSQQLARQVEELLSVQQAAMLRAAQASDELLAQLRRMQERWDLSSGATAQRGDEGEEVVAAGSVSRGDGLVFTPQKPTLTASDVEEVLSQLRQRVQALSGVFGPRCHAALVLSLLHSLPFGLSVQMSYQNAWCLKLTMPKLHWQSATQPWQTRRTGLRKRTSF